MVIKYFKYSDKEAGLKFYEIGKLLRIYFTYKKITKNTTSKMTENCTHRLELSNSKQLHRWKLLCKVWGVLFVSFFKKKTKHKMKMYWQVKHLVRHRNTSIKCENKRTASRKKFHFLAVGDNTQLLPGSIFLFINCVLGNLNHRTAAKVAWSLHISTPNSCSETGEAQENLQIENLKLLQLQYLQCVAQNSASTKLAGEHEEQI